MKKSKIRKSVPKEDDLESVRNKYNQLIMAVENKYEGETRHETALRLIQESQNGEGGKQGMSKIDNDSEARSDDPMARAWLSRHLIMLADLTDSTEISYWCLPRTKWNLIGV